MRSNTPWLTIYNAYADPTTRRPAYQRFAVPSVTWENRRAANKAAAGEIAANKATVYIPLTRCQSYLDPKAWLASAERASYWTLQEGDVIVRGFVTDTLSDAFTVTALKAKYEDVLVISGVDKMDMGGRAIAHYQVEAM